MSAIPPSPRCDPRDVAARPSEIVSRSPEFPSSANARPHERPGTMHGFVAQPANPGFCGVIWKPPSTSSHRVARYSRRTPHDRLSLERKPRSALLRPHGSSERHPILVLHSSPHVPCLHLSPTTTTCREIRHTHTVLSIAHHQGASTPASHLRPTPTGGGGHCLWHGMAAMPSF
jgi:hypothetical protein